MRSIIPIALAVACPIGMCLVPMLLMRRQHNSGSGPRSGPPEESKEILSLREEVAALRGEIAERHAAQGSSE